MICYFPCDIFFYFGTWAASGSSSMKYDIVNECWPWLQDKTSSIKVFRCWFLAKSAKYDRKESWFKKYLIFEISKNHLKKIKSSISIFANILQILSLNFVMKIIFRFSKMEIENFQNLKKIIENIFITTFEIFMIFWNLKN